MKMKMILVDQVHRSWSLMEYLGRNCGGEEER
jgi:hypothetical protein